MLTIGLYMPRGSQSSKRHRATVLIAARNEAANIAACLNAIAAQDYPAELLDVIVIDDNSTDQTTAIAKSFRSQIPGLRVIDAGTPPMGIAPKKHALSVGIASATSAIILTTDADCTPPPGWIGGMVSCFADDVQAVAGFAPLDGSGIAGAIGRLDALINAVVSAGTIGIGSPATVTGRNFAYRKSAWEAVGGFGDTAKGASGDDDLLLQRISSSGGKVAFCDDPVTFVPSPAQPSVAAWLKMKRRHLSAGKRYQMPLLAFATLLYLFQVGLAVSFAFSLSGAIGWTGLLMVWMAKIAFDGIALGIGARRFKQRNWRVSWLVAEVLSPLIFAIIVPVSLFGKISWKGRQLNN